nr:MAG TPA: hypothetical protein [Caudoviricetes sp.]
MLQCSSLSEMFALGKAPCICRALFHIQFCNLTTQCTAPTSP